MERVRIRSKTAHPKVNQPDEGAEGGALKPQTSSRQQNKNLRPRLPGIERRRLRIPQIEFVPLKSLKRSFRNARIHSKAQIRQIANSIREFGWTSPILTDEYRNVLAGDGRRESAAGRSTPSATPS